MSYVPLPDIVTAAAEVSGWSLDAITGPRRLASLTDIRKAIAVVARECDHSQAAIAHALGRSDHSSVRYYYDSGLWLRDHSGPFASLCELIKQRADVIIKNRWKALELSLEPAGSAPVTVVCCK